MGGGLGGEGRAGVASAGGGCEAGLVVGDAVGGLIRLQGQVSATASAAG